MGKQHKQDKAEVQLKRERNRLLSRLQAVLEGPMVVLGLIWLALLLIELTKGLNPALELVSGIIWVIFILNFLLELVLAPDKSTYFRHNILTTISLLVPALRVFRLARLFRAVRTVRAVRSLRLVKLLSSLNRGMKSLSAAMRRRAFGYVLALTLVVTITGAAGMYAFESGHGLPTFSEALWWTAMLLISIGSDYFPVTPEGRILCFLLALYGFAVFGYFTATLATFFIDRDAGSSSAEVAGAKQVKLLHNEIKQLRAELQLVLEQQQQGPSKPPESGPEEV